MSGPTFVSARLSFGRHDGTWDLDTDAGPVIVSGANGAGKTSMVEGLLRTIFGFHRRQPADRALLNARRPWGGRPFTSSVKLLTARGEELEWRRDFDSDEVVVLDSSGIERFRGSAKLGGTSATERRYRELVEEIFGISDLESYTRTAWIEQGRTLDTGFDSDLLRLADGGHARVLEALERVKRAHRDLTRAAVADGERRAARDGALEKAVARRGEVEAELARARSASADLRVRRDRLAEVDDRVTKLEETLETLERRRREWLELRRVRAELTEARLLLDRITSARSELVDARREVDVAEAEAERLGRTAAYPTDFVDRTHELQALWSEIEGLDEGRAESPAGSGFAWHDGLSVFAAVAFLVGGALGVRAGESFGWPMLAGGVALAVHAVASALDRRSSRAQAAARSAGRTERLVVLRDRVERLLDGVPDGVTLAPATIGERRAAFERSRAAEARLEAARRAFLDTARRVETLGEVTGTPGRTLPLLEADAERTVREKELELSTMEGRMARRHADREDERLDASSVDFGESIARAEEELHELKAERDRLLVAVDRAQRDAVELPALERDVAEAERRVDEARLSARVCRAAWALLRDGYDEYREHDEGRLVAAVARHLERLSAGSLGGFLSTDGLRSPSVEVDGASVGLDSPHLSYGQRHIVMLAVRLGAADFHASAGPAIPLVIDEPFAHLDDEHARLVIRLLAGVAQERQVVITTQDEALLARLGVRPTIRLSGGEVSNGGLAVRPDTGAEGHPASDPLNAGETTRV